MVAMARLRRQATAQVTRQGAFTSAIARTLAQRRPGHDRQHQERRQRRGGGHKSRQQAKQTQADRTIDERHRGCLARENALADKDASIFCSRAHGLYLPNGIVHWHGAGRSRGEGADAGSGAAGNLACHSPRPMGLGLYFPSLISTLPDESVAARAMPSVLKRIEIWPSRSTAISPPVSAGSTLSTMY
jgi:hypothetical protein